MKKVDLAYIAGLTDGEGWIGIQGYRRKGRQVLVSISLCQSYLPHGFNLPLAVLFLIKGLKRLIIKINGFGQSKVKRLMSI